MTTHIYPEWRDQNRDRSYPFGDDATFRSSDGAYLFPKTAFLDARIYPNGGTEGQYISAVTRQDLEIELEIRDGFRVLCTATFGVTEYPEVIPAYDSGGRPAGVLVTDPNGIKILSGWGTGRTEFPAAALPFAASTVIPRNISGLTGFVTPDGEQFSGDVWMVTGRGVVWSEDGEGVPALNFTGETQLQRWICAVNRKLYPEVRVLRTVNHLEPNSVGNINLVVGNAVADSVLRVDVEDGVIDINTVGGRNA